MFELSRNPEILQKVQNELDEVLTKHGKLSYDSLSELKYLECCIEETLRKYPIVPIHFRTAAEDCKIPGTEISIDANTPIFIPVLGIQRDPSIYENPMEFRPERFLNSPNGGAKGNGLSYTPFGEGPSKL
jgi:cytochrome P450 family 6